MLKLLFTANPVVSRTCAHFGRTVGFHSADGGEKKRDFK